MRLFQEHTPFGECQQRVIPMITQPNIAGGTNCYEIGGVIIGLIMVYVMNLQSPLSFTAFSTALLALVAIPFSYQFLKTASKTRAVRYAYTTRPIRIKWTAILCRYTSYCFRRMLLAIKRIGAACLFTLANQRQFLPCLWSHRDTFIPAFVTPFIPAGLYRFGYTFNWNLFTFVCKSSPRRRLPFVPRFLPFFKACKFTTRLVTVSVGRWLMHFIDRWNHLATAASTWYRWHSRIFGILVHPIGLLLFGWSYAHMNIISYRQLISMMEVHH